MRSTGWYVRKITRHRAFAAVAIAFALQIGSATAATQSVTDPAGDVLSCSGECSSWNQDLQSVSVEESGQYLTFTISQYGAFTSGCTCFFPQLQFYDSSNDVSKPDFYTAAYNGTPGPSYPIGLFYAADSQASPCSSGGYGGAYGVGNLSDVTVTVIDDHTASYSFPANQLPTTFRWRAAEPAQSRCQTQGNPETAPLDIAPDVGLATFTQSTSGTSGSGGGTTTQPAPATAPVPSELVPFKGLIGIRLGMTAAQAKRGVGGNCPTLTARTRRDRGRYPCWFTFAALQPPQEEFIYGNNGSRCGADMTLSRGRIFDIGSNCKVRLPSGAGIGSTFKEMYRSFRAGTVRCRGKAQFNDECIAQQKTRHGIYYTEFDDGKPIDRLPRRVVAELQIGKCLRTYKQLNWRHTFQQCDPRFLKARVPNEFKP